MIRISWDRKELANELKKEIPFSRLSIPVSISIDGIEIIPYAQPELKLLFNDLYAIFCYLDPKSSETRKTYTSPQDHLSILALEIRFSLSEEDPDKMIIHYPSDPSSSLVIDRKKIVQFKDFVKSVLDANLVFLDDCVTVNPGLQNNPQWMQLDHEYKMMKSWYTEKWKK
ncbi:MULTISPECIES: hypothetical protein [unclassified Methanoregula]|uniref:hypothetical protein n=1 Tax=unclassified Methanoregula TaxID=2649730 RepID=UPI0009D5084D|nr:MULTISPECIES: hypothetical protein [unclassified Methanoregula]OPX64696.1 MAG: hypothetical protein A4E33_00783 [Methanoregula sp. PtaB.Bin085]OPY36064.1 MAG: hypothetical protein A4E34_00471 [Methanoregula sp. PtaU1.Bin006]